MPRPELDYRFPQTTYSFEIEFLVAQELPGFNYDSTLNYFHGSCDALPWACPADEKDPYQAILEGVKELLLRYGQPVANGANVSAPQPYAGDASCWPFQRTRPIDRPDEFWHVEPSVTTYAKRDGPQMYEWFGVRLRSPTYQSKIFVANDIESPTEWILDVLRKSLVIHLNSTCRFNVQVRPLTEAVSLLHVKKLVTLVWVLEKELFERLSPNSYGRLHPHVRTLEAHSRVASLIWHGSGERSPQKDPLNSAVTNLHLPDLQNKELLARLHFLWQMQSLDDLTAALRTTTGQDTSLAIRPTGGPFDTPIFEFRYALWHPFGQLDASKHWIELSSKLVQTSLVNASTFKRNVTLLDGIIYNSSKGDTPPTLRWRALLAIMDLEKWSDSWEFIISQYKDGQRLAARSLDKQKLLHEELKKTNGEMETTA